MGPAAKKAISAAVLALALLVPVESPGALNKCVGPAGEVVIVNTECPDGYRIEHSVPASEPSSSGSENDPYICRAADFLTVDEIAGALAEAQESLQEARSKGAGEREQYWTKCLADLRRREQRLQSADEAQEEQEEHGPMPCADGEFEYKEGAIFFTSASRGACQGLRALCTFDVRRSQRVVRSGGRGPADRLRGDEYTTVASQEVQEFSHAGKIGKFGKARLGDVSITGRVTGWSCRILN